MIGLETGSVFAGRYEIIRSIGAGGMGAVYLACDPTDRNFKVALKILYPGTIQSNQARQRFRNEITASYRINHPNVIRAYEYFDAEDMQAFAMEYVEGGDLLQHMRAGPLAADEVALWLKQIASALEAVHKAGIIHRDLKPENILVTRKGEIKISDFGVARLKGAHTLTQANSMVGTPKYLAPEYVETGECDGRGDIFAVGVIGYELISGASPFGKDLKPNMIYDRVKMQIPPLEKIAPSCPVDLARIIERAMSMQLSKRYQSARDMLLDLERYERGESLSENSAEDSAENASLADSGNAAFQDWDTPSNNEIMPRVDASEAQYFARAQPLPVNGRPPVWIAGIAVGLLIAAAGVASMLIFQANNPFQGLKQGVYQGYVKAPQNQIPLAVWSYPNHAFVLLGKEGCAAAALPRNGNYHCQSGDFKILVDTVGPDTASGRISRGNSGEADRWTVSTASQKSGDVENGSTANRAVTAKLPEHPAAKVNHEIVKNGPEKKSPETEKLESIEAALRAGQIAPEDAARSLLEIHNSESRK